MFEGQRDNLALWNRCRFVDPKHTSGYKGKGGFAGTSTNATYLIQRATEEFGPVGIGWNWDIIDAYYIDGAPMIADDGTNYGHEKLHVIRASIWYINDGVKSVGTPHFGQTTFVGLQRKAIWKENKKVGEREIPVSDEEHAKKSLTDAITKALSCIGFASDIYKGMWDDNKYVNQMKQEAQERLAGPSGGNGKSVPDERTVTSPVGVVRQDQSARTKEAERAKAIEAVKADIRSKKTYKDIGQAMAKGAELATSYGDDALHEEFRSLANLHWASVKPKGATQ